MVLFISCVNAFVLLDVFHITFSHKFCAYLDPGTGSIIIQVVIAGLFGLIFFIKLFWGKIKSLFKNLLSKSNKAEKNED
jgi:uncharacterized membrane protein